MVLLNIDTYPSIWIINSYVQATFQVMIEIHHIYIYIVPLTLHLYTKEKPSVLHFGVVIDQAREREREKLLVHMQIYCTMNV